MSNQPKKHWIKVKWGGVNRSLEYIPVRYLRDRPLTLVRAFEYAYRQHPLTLLEVQTGPNGEITRTILFGKRRRDLLRLLKWDGKEPIKVAFVKEQRGTNGQPKSGQYSGLASERSVETPGSTDVATSGQSEDDVTGVADFDEDGGSADRGGSEAGHDFQAS